MPVQIIQRKRPRGDEAIANAILAGTQGFVQGQQMKRQRENDTIANAYRNAQIGELNRKSEALNAPVPENYTRDSYSGRLVADAGAVAKAKAQANYDVASQFLNQQGGGVQGGNYPPGTTLKAGPLTIPLNPSLTEGEARTFGTVPTIKKAADDFNSNIDKGVLETGDPGLVGNIKSAYRSFAVDSGYAPLTFGKKELSDLQSSLNTIKANTLFSEGGKSLTVNEKRVIENLYSTKGKSKERIISDVNTGIQKYQEFINAKKQGAQGYKPSATLPKNPNQKPGGQVMTDADGNRAMVYPDGTFEEI